MGLLDVNYMAVLVASVASMIVGFIWYSKRVFGGKWMKNVGLDKKKMEGQKKKGMAGTMIAAFATTLIMAVVLANIIKFMGVSDVAGGLYAGFLVWLGFLATTDLGIVLWESKPASLYCIKTGHNLASLLVMGAVLAAMI
ncbi:DUF1761 domain-containing protein [Candidatus Woesearchaeota archaeon]|nr:DUF1761 domain-containing protein [Candidatus Woesearchaeota archaeon]